MITASTISNTVILSDSIKDQFREVQKLFGENIKLASHLLDTNDFQTSLQVISGHARVRNKVVNIILTSCYFLESLVNSYGYYKLELAGGTESADREFTKFSDKSTDAKWSELLSHSDQGMKGDIRDLFDFRNFIVHSKPVKKVGDKFLVYKKVHGWVPIGNVSSYINELLPTGLLLEQISPDTMNKVVELVNKLVQSLAPDYVRHYKLELDQNFIKSYDDYLNEYNRIQQEYGQKNASNIEAFLSKINPDYKGEN